MRTLLILLLASSFATYVFGHCTFTGRSGAPGQGTCSSSCHGNPGGSLTFTGFPETYTPDQSYLITVSHSGGDAIANFNSSCRVGTGTANAGVIGAGTNTSTYSAAGETNGVHFATCFRDSGTFSWTAPAAGTGTVRMYAGSLQGTDADLGFYTTLVLVSDEAAGTPPDAPQNLVITPISSSIQLYWDPSAGATSYNIYRDVTSSIVPAPTNLIGTVTTTSFVDTAAAPGGSLRFYVVTALAP